MDEPTTAQTFKKRVLQLAGILVLGALGSGLWSRGFEPLLSLMVRLAAGLFGSVKDGIYVQAARGFHEHPSIAVLQLLLCAVVAWTSNYAGSIMGLAHARKKQEAGANGERIKPPAVVTLKSQERVAMFVTLILVIGVSSVIFRIAKDEWINTTITYSLQSIEILAPNISDHERLVLRSQFFSVQNAGDYRVFYDHLNALAAQHQTRLPPFSPL